jgi:hypothetical protein
MTLPLCNSEAYKESAVPPYGRALFSKHSTFCGKTTQCWAERVQMCLSILNQLGSSNVPPKMARPSGNLSRVAVTVVPHRLQKCSRNQRLLSSEVCSYVVSPSPVNSTFSWAKKTAMPQTLPVRRWQNVQWHTDTSVGSPLTRYRIAPQRQPPS